MQLAACGAVVAADVAAFVVGDDCAATDVNYSMIEL